MAYLPNRGDIVHLDFDPASGQEIEHPSNSADAACDRYSGRPAALQSLDGVTDPSSFCALQPIPPSSLANPPLPNSKGVGPHFGLVLSGRLFNQQGLAMICPISQGRAEHGRTYGTVVTLMGSGTDTQGAVHCHQLKSLDWRVRRVRLKETVPTFVIDDVLARVEAILFD